LGSKTVQLSLRYTQDWAETAAGARQETLFFFFDIFSYFVLCVGTRILKLHRMSVKKTEKLHQKVHKDEKTSHDGNCAFQIFDTNFSIKAPFSF